MDCNVGYQTLEIEIVPFFCGLLADLPLFFFLSLARNFKFDRDLDLSAEVARSSRPRRVHFAVPGRLDLR